MFKKTKMLGRLFCLRKYGCRFETDMQNHVNSVIHIQLVRSIDSYFCSMWTPLSGVNSIECQLDHIFSHQQHGIYLYQSQNQAKFNNSCHWCIDSKPPKWYFPTGGKQQILLPGAIIWTLFVVDRNKIIMCIV